MQQRLVSQGFAIAAMAFAFASQAALAQAPGPQLPRPSPNASVSQTIGVTEVTVRYSRPGVKSRVIWGKLGP
jgi:hypothetical protein